MFSDTQENEQAFGHCTRGRLAVRLKKVQVDGILVRFLWRSSKGVNGPAILALPQLSEQNAKNMPDTLREHALSPGGNMGIAMLRTKQSKISQVSQAKRYPGS